VARRNARQLAGSLLVTLLLAAGLAACGDHGPTNVNHSGPGHAPASSNAKAQD